MVQAFRGAVAVVGDRAKGGVLRGPQKFFLGPYPLTVVERPWDARWLPHRGTSQGVDDEY